MTKTSETKVCSDCGSKKAQLCCGSCQATLCKSCAQFLDIDFFALMPEARRPAVAKESVYCGACYHDKVAPEIARYEELLENAKNISIYMRDQGKETRFIRRIELPVKVEDGTDYQETMLKLAFFAALGDFNAVLDVEIKSAKVRNGGYQSTVFTGTGVPAKVDESKLIKDRSLWQNPN
jgi:hypothetical protein